MKTQPKTQIFYKSALLWIVGLTALTVGPAAHAVEYFWTGAGGDAIWNNPGNWGGSGAPTTAADTAIFDTQAAVPYTVEFDRNTTNNTTKVGRDNVAIDLNGYTNTITSTVPLYIAESSGQTGTLHVAGSGTLKIANSTYLAYSANTKGTLVLSGSNTVLEAVTVYLGRRDNSLGVLQLEEGAQAIITTLYPGAGGTGIGKVVVSNAMIAASNFRLGFVATARGEMLMTGPDARWMNIGSPEAMIGWKGQGELTLLNGAKAAYGPLYLSIGKEGTATGMVTVAGAGSIIGGVEGESYVRTVTLGGLTKGTVTIPPVLGGVGTLNLFDGGALQGAGISTPIYFFIGAGSRIRIRDGSINWCTDGLRTQPFFFSPGSYYTVELTAASEAFTAATPLIWSGANDAGAARMNLIDNANLEVTLAEGFEPESGAVFNIFKYTGDLAGTFADLPEGSEIQTQGMRLRIGYGSRTDDTITLTALPPRGTVLIIR